MAQVDKARKFKELHVPGKPVVLYNIWDAGSARAVADAGAQAIATGSWSVAEALGFPDGQALPLNALLTAARGIVAATDLPTSVDFEGGYAVAPDAVAAHVTRLIETGAIGLNFEDQVVGGAGLHELTVQVERITAVRRAAEAAGVPMVVNARTDIFLQADNDPAHQRTLVDSVLERGRAYAGAGADCFFVPGLTEPDIIAQICRDVPLPVNVLHTGDAAGLAPLAEAGVARISHGPAPWRNAMAALTQAARPCYSG